MKIRLLAIAFAITSATASLAQEPPPPPKPPTPQERLKHVGEKLDKELQLSADQKQKVLNAYKDFFTGMDKAKVDNPPPPPPPPVNKEEVDKLMKERDEKIKAVLNDEQFKKYEAVEKTMRPHRPGPHGEHPAPRPISL